MGWFVLCWKKAFVWSGRARRREFWLFALFDRIFCVLLGGIAYTGVMSVAKHGEAAAGAMGLLPVLASWALIGYGLASLFPFFAVTVRRFHDVNRGAGWALLVLAALLLSTAGNFIQVVQIATKSVPPSTGIPSNGFLDAALCLWVFLAVFAFLRSGTPGPNRYGPSPK